jgi:hypothetical protein
MARGDTELVQLRIGVGKRTESRWSRSRLRLEPEAAVEARPRTRADCADGPRPCPWVSCRYHLATEVGHSGSLTIRFAVPGGKSGEPQYDDGVAWDAMDDTCSLDVADEGGASLERVAWAMNIDPERVRQIEREAIGRLRAYGGGEP